MRGGGALAPGVVMYRGGDEREWRRTGAMRIWKPNRPKRLARPRKIDLNNFALRREY
jgi:hypothetical protein